MKPNRNPINQEKYRARLNKKEQKSKNNYQKQDESVSKEEIAVE